MSEPQAPVSTDRHTPGPWKEHAPNIDGEVDKTYRQITAGVGYFPGLDEPESAGFKLTGFISPADARLIAAAPELLAACKRLGAVINDHVSLADVDALDAAIAKAEGRSNV